MEERKCESCGHKLSGRTDQRFCNDDCRNKYNRAKRIADRTSGYGYMKAIIAIIKNNYEILRKSNLREGGEALSDMGKIKDIGINPKFYTSTLKEGYKTWYCCFDYGWY